MVDRRLVADFLAERKLALVGMSRKGKKFGNAVYKDLTAKGYRLFPVHPEATVIEGARCWPSLETLPEAVGGVVIVVPPAETEQVVKAALGAGVRRVWMQQGSESPAAIRFCQENGMSVVHGECILMFAEPAAFFHRLHRWLWRLLGKLPPAK